MTSHVYIHQSFLLYSIKKWCLTLHESKLKNEIATVLITGSDVTNKSIIVPGILHLSPPYNKCYVS